MSGIKHRATETHSANSTNFFGILYAEDFDDPVEPAVDHTPAEPEPVALTQDDLDAACADAVKNARVEWQREDERQRVTALVTLESAIAALQDTAEASALAVAEGAVTTILSIVSGLLPEFSGQHGPAEVRALLAHLLPTVRSSAKITVRVHSSLVPMIQRDVDQLEPDLRSMIVISAAPMEPGDLKVSWDNGSLTRDSSQIIQAIQDVLGQLGLHQKVETPAKRIMAYAD